jgi:putative glutamine amidotransferase
LGLPLIGITCCFEQLGVDQIHQTRDRYLKAVVVNQVGVPVLLPAIGQQLDVQVYLKHLSGLLLTGSDSNIDPSHYQSESTCSGSRHDRARDDTTLPLIRAAVAAKLPILAICRGMQELNVALGGTLHQQLDERIEGLAHLGDMYQPDHLRFAPVHSVALTAEGQLHRLLGQDQMLVNSQHGQGINQLADDLRVEAVAPDGVIEAVRHQNPDYFALGVQWHPEWAAACSAPPCGNSQAIFQAFGAAVRRYSQREKRAGA